MKTEELKGNAFADVAVLYEKARKRAKLTQTELANRAGMAPANVSRFESGKYNPSYEMMERIAAAMGMTLEVKLIKKR